jgi:hypothetical protein
VIAAAAACPPIPADHPGIASATQSRTAYSYHLGSSCCEDKLAKLPLLTVKIGAAAQAALVPAARPVVAQAAAAPPVRVNGPTGPAIRPMAITLEIVGTAKGDCGRSCEEHNCCGREVLQEDVVVRLRREQILVPNKVSKGYHEEAAYTVNWVMEGFDCCHVGFLGRAYITQGGLFDGILCQVVSIGNAHGDDHNEHAKVKHVCGYACAQVISPLNEG